MRSGNVTLPFWSFDQTRIEACSQKRLKIRSLERRPLHEKLFKIEIGDRIRLAFILEELAFTFCST